MTVYEKVKAMTLDELNDFLQWVYMTGNLDGFNGCSDGEIDFFGARLLKSDESALERFESEKWTAEEKKLVEDL